MTKRVLQDIDSSGKKYFTDISEGTTNVLTLDNTTPFTPANDYEPATKKYVDNSITEAGGYTDENAQDACGAMVTGNTETGISVTYDDTNAKLNFIVATQSDNNFTNDYKAKLDGISPNATVYNDEMAQDTIGGILTDSSEIDFTYDDETPSITAIVKDNSISDSKLRQSAGYSIIGKATTGTGNVADITAGSNGVLRRSGTGNLAFGTIVAGNIASSAVTYSKIQNVSATDKILGRVSAGAGVVEEITCTSAGRALLDDADVTEQKTTLGLENVQNYDIATQEEAQEGIVNNKYMTPVRVAEYINSLSIATSADQVSYNNSTSEIITSADVQNALWDLDFNLKTFEDDIYDNVLFKGDTTAYTPTTDYSPATKLYVDTKDNSWVSVGESWSTQSAVNAPIFTANTSSDLTGKLCIGMKIRLVHDSTTKYFIITAITSDTVTLYGGTDYSINLSPVNLTDVYYSASESPFGFPTDSSKWNEVTLWTNASPTSAFTAQAVTISSMTPYTKYRVYAKHYTTFSFIITADSLIGYGGYITEIDEAGNRNGRKFTYTNDTTITFDNAKSNGTNDNNRLIPIKIVGYL